jgi:hypothetical protein
MEDRDKSEAANAENIVELTPDMEVTNEFQIDIIELTDIVDGPDEVEPLASPVTETLPEIDQKPSQPPRGSAFSSAIEQEVEAAFDYVQSPISEATPEEQLPVAEEGLIDKFSDIPQMVDDALDASGTLDAEMEEAADEAVQKADSQRSGTGAQDDVAADAGKLDAAQAEFNLDEENDEIIELTDIVDPRELQAQDLDDDEIIELTDIVDPRELQQGGLQTAEDDEIIELTDIVDPSELHVAAVTAEQDESETVQAADAAVEDQEYEDLLEMIDNFDTEDLLVDIEDEEDQGPESISIEKEADIPEATVEDAAPLEPDGVPEEDREYAELLDTIDRLDPDDLLVSVDEAGLLAAGDSDSASPAEEQVTPEEDELMTLSDVLNRRTADEEEKPPVEDPGMFTREVEEETGRKARTLTDQEIEAAVERILKSKYAETIERLIANAVEKAVNREIEILKRNMLDDDEPLA